MKRLWTEAGANPESDWVSLAVSNEFKRRWPELHRDMGGKILARICETEGTFRTINDIEFAADSLFCEFAYVIDFDDNTFSWYEGFNRTPLAETERFAFLTPNRDGEYSPVREKGSVPLKPECIPDWTKYDYGEE